MTAAEQRDPSCPGGGARQEPTAKEPFAVEYSGVRYEVEPQFEYELTGMVVSYRQHNGWRRLHRASNDQWSVADLCSGGAIRQRARICRKSSSGTAISPGNFERSDSVAWERILPEQISNNT